MILRNFAKIHLFGKILTHGSMEDLFSRATPLPPKNQRAPFQEGALYLYTTYM